MTNQSHLHPTAQHEKDVIKDLSQDSRPVYTPLPLDSLDSHKQMLSALGLDSLIPEDAPVSDLINSAHLDTTPHHDPVHHPHYYDTPGGRETKDIILDLLGPEGYKAWAIGNSIKYLSRYDRKENAIQDLRKAIEYIQMVISEIADN